MITKDKLQGELDKIMVNHPEFEPKLKFGSRAYESKGNLCAGIFQDMLVLNLGKERVSALLERDHTRPMDIIGRLLEDWIILEEPVYSDENEMHELVEAAVERVKTLPRKY